MALDPYQSTHTGAEIDAGIELAETSVQPSGLTAAIDALKAESDPFPIYLTQTEGDSRYLKPVVQVASSGAAQAIAFPSSGDRCYDVTLNANCTFTLSGGAAGQLQTITLIIRQSGGGGFIPTLPSSIKWPNGTPPTPNTVVGRIDKLVLQTSDSGTTYIGSY